MNSKKYIPFFIIVLFLLAWVVYAINIGTDLNLGANKITNVKGISFTSVTSSDNAIRFFDGSELTSAIPTGITGGQQNYIPKWLTSTTLGTSTIYQLSNGNVGIGTAVAGAKLEIQGGNIGLSPEGKQIGFMGPLGFDTYYIRGGTEAGGRTMSIGSRTSGVNITFQTYDNNFSFNSGVTETTRMIIQSAGNVGIGDTSPASLLTVGNGDLFQVNSSGNIVKINNITYSWPSSAPAANTYLKSLDTSGNLTWATAGGVTGSGANNKVAFWTGASNLSYNDNFHWDNTNSRLGIMTIAPTEKLDVWGAIKVAGAQTGAGLGLILSDESGYKCIQSYNSEPLAINPAGQNVGIGTVNPESKLQIGAPYQDNYVGSVPVLRVLGNTLDTISQTMLRLNRPLSPNNFYNSGVDFNIYSYGTAGIFPYYPKTQLDIALKSTAVQIETGNVTVMSLRDNGYVGIGTTAPNKLLHVYKDSGDNAEIDIQSIAGANKQWAIYHDRATSDLRFWNNDISGEKNTLTLKNTGNVGIGTTGPDAKLHVIGSICAELSDTDCAPALTSGYIRGAGLCIGADCRTSWLSGGTVTSISAGTGITLSPNPIIATGTVSLNLASANTWTGAQTFSGGANFPGSGIWNTSGNVGIGTAGPLATLEVNRVANDSGKILRLGNLTAGFDFARSSETGALSIQGSQTGYNDILLVPTSGNVGIGTTDPGAGLEINKGSTNNLALLLTSSGADWGSGMRFKNTGVNGKEFGIYSANDGVLHFQNYSLLKDNMRFYNDSVYVGDISGYMNAALYVNTYSDQSYAIYASTNSTGSALLVNNSGSGPAIKALTGTCSFDPCISGYFEGRLQVANKSGYGDLTMDETTGGPSSPTADSQARIFIRGDKLVIQWYETGSGLRYKYLPLSGTGVTWSYSATLP